VNAEKPSAARSRCIPASAAHLRMWLHDQRFPDSRAYVTPIAIWLDGQLDDNALERAFAATVRRHDQLHSIFTASGDGLVQSTVRKRKPKLNRTNILADNVKEWLEAEFHRGFDLGRGPLFRASLLHLHSNEHLFVITVHHIISDGWSMGLLLRDLSVAYRREIGETQDDWPSLSGSLHATFELERKCLGAPNYDARLASATKLLEGAPAAMSLPFGAVPDGVEQCATIRESLNAEAMSEIAHFARKSGTTSFTVYLAAYAALLARYTGQDDLLIGVPIAGRGDSTAARTVGLFLNMLPLRLRVNGQESWRELIARTRNSLLDAMCFGDIPVDHILASSQRKQPQAIFVVQPDALPSLDLPGIKSAWCFIDNIHTKADLTFKLDQASVWSPETGTVETGFFATLEYPASRQSKKMAQRMTRHFETILNAIITNPSGAVGDVDLFTQQEQILRQSCLRLDRPHNGVDPIEMFDAQTARTPDAVAIWHNGKALSYKALAERVCDFQHAFEVLGLRPDERVGVCLTRTPDLVAALLAILRSGATYVPLDPAYPLDRLGFILADTSCALVLVEDETSAAVSACDSKILDISSIVSVQATPPARITPLPCRIAYIIYTSGSTGRPKGISIPIKSFQALIGWAIRFFDFDELSETLASTSICFDMSVFEIFAPLCIGGSLRLVDNALGLLELPDASVTLIDTVPSAIAAIIRSDVLSETVRTINLGGEALPRKLVDQVHTRWPNARIVNLYGPSEDTTFSTWCEVPRGSTEEPPIGVPLDGTNAYVLDSRLVPVPAGVRGELYLGGAGVALGYFGRPDLTAERFVPDPFCDEPGARMYATGDSVCLTESGDLRYFGRGDNQVKLRGFRIELGEIENVIRNLTGVTVVQVLCRKVNGESQLVCYWTGTATQNQLQAEVTKTLPSYMVPGFWIALSAFPLNANGKIDRGALPTPTIDRQHISVPETPTERMVADAFSSLIGCTAIGRDTDFFAVGGHSLLAMRLGSELRRCSGVRIPLADLFRHRTVAKLASVIDAADRDSGDDAEPKALLHHSSRPTLPVQLSFGQERMWLVERLRPDRAMLNITEAFRFSGSLDLVALRSAIAFVTKRHAALRLRICIESDGSPKQIALPADEIAMEHFQSMCPEKTDELLRTATARSFSLAYESPVRWLVITEGAGSDDEAHIVAIVAHHIAVDGFSLRLLFAELEAAYEAAQLDSAPTFPAPLSVIDFALWQRDDLAQSHQLNSGLDYWQAQLAGTPERLQLPATELPTPQAPFSASRISRRFPTQVTQGLISAGATVGATPFMSMLALYHSWLSRVSGQSDVVVGIPIASRDESGSETIVGCLLNTLAIRIPEAQEKNFADLTAEVRDRCLEAFANQFVPFELVVDRLALPRNADHAPLTQTMFVFESEPRANLRFGQFVGAPMTVQAPATQFDLTLQIVTEADHWTFTWHYRADLFSAEMVECLADSFECLLNSVTENPNRPITLLPMVSPDHVASAVASAAAPATMGELFDRQASLTPDALAIGDQFGELRFGELRTLVDSVAHKLNDAGVRVEDRVVIIMPRNRWAIIAMLAVTKVGGVFLCLDPMLPKERRDWIMDDAEVVLQITAADAKYEHGHNPVPVFRLDSAALLRCPPVAYVSPPSLNAESLAYIIYTSGSTGHPKGVMVPHRGIAQLAMLHRSLFAAGPGKQVLQYSPVSFDASIWESIMGLTTGACLHLVDAENLRPGLPLAETLARLDITHLTIPPSNLAMVDSLPDTVQHLILAGEPCPSDAASRWGSHAAIWNAYGPTEVTVCATIKACDPKELTAPTIGNAIPGVEVFILDAGMNPLPPLVPGELYVGGDGLARGYVGKPTLTATSFVPHPNSSTDGALLYRTGDLARFTVAGEIEFLGRRDDQVKLRGIRVELGEVEACIIAADPRISGAAALVIGPPSGRILVAFVTAVPAVDLGSVRELLAVKLPAYLVPAWIERLDKLPLTANGKLDRNMLAVKATSTRRKNVPRARPRGPVEEGVAAIWRHLLPDTEIGRNDDFFSVGGNSLTLTKLHQLLVSNFETGIGIVDLFRLNTVSAIAEAIEKERITPEMDMVSCRF
jgi:amino acid adenylation domain-containing protein